MALNSFSSEVAERLASLGVPVYKGTPPSQAKPPYVTVRDIRGATEDDSLEGLDLTATGEVGVYCTAPSFETATKLALDVGSVLCSARFRVEISPASQPYPRQWESVVALSRRYAI